MKNSNFNSALYLMAVLFGSMLFSGCSKVLINPSEQESHIEDFEIAWNIVNDTYQYFEWKGIDWDTLYHVYHERAKTARGDEFYQVINDMLAELKDGHVYYQTQGGGYTHPYLSPRWLKDRKSYSPLVVRDYFNTQLSTSQYEELDYGILDGNIGYIYISKFEPHGIANVLSDVLNVLKNTDALILDIRNNQGGNKWDAHLMVSQFISEPLETPIYYKLGEPDQFPSIEPYEINPYLKPIIVLINGASYSSSECFADLMKQVPHATVVGDTTGGGSSGFELNVPALCGKYKLPGGITIKIPTIDSRCCNGEPWESVGVAPDIRIEQTENDINNGFDRQLEYAISSLQGQ